jgi:hypothetical protein
LNICAKSLTCGREAVLGDYPGDAAVYFFTDLKPVSRYIYMWPWVAQVALPDEVDRLRQGEVIVRLEPILSVWGRPTRTYLADVINYVESHYVPAGDYDFLSPELAERCPPPLANQNP